MEFFLLDLTLTVIVNVSFLILNHSPTFSQERRIKFLLIIYYKIDAKQRTLHSNYHIWMLHFHIIHHK